MPTTVRAVSVQELKTMLDEKQDIQLIDVREPHEHEFCNIGGDLIPMGTIASNTGRISKDKNVILYCRSGARSGRIVAALQAQFGFTNLFNLDGGILAWSDEIDPTVPQY